MEETVLASMKTVMTFGTFDLLHLGHMYVLQQAKKLGDRFIVVVARDKTVLRLKKKLPCHQEQLRKKNIQMTRLADKVVLGHRHDHLYAIKKYKPEVIALGYDQRFFANSLRKDLLAIGLKKTKIVRLKAYKPHLYKTTFLAKR